MGWFSWRLRLIDNGVEHIPTNVAVSLKGTKHRYGFGQYYPYPNTTFMLPAESVPQDRYAIAVVFHQLHHLKDFEAVVMFNGAVVTDPAYGQPFPKMTKGGETVPLSDAQPAAGDAAKLAAGSRLTYPRDFRSRCFLALDCPPAGAADIRDAKVWLGNTQLTTGPGGGLVASSERYYRGVVEPGRHTLKVEHPDYKLETATTIVCNSTLVVQRINLRPVVPIVSHLAIRGPARYVDKNQPLTLTTNLPQEFQGHAQWTTSDAAVLRHDGAGKFFGVSAGLAEVTASIKAPRPLQAKARITVVGAPGQMFVRPIDPNAVIQAGGGHVVRGELLVRFKSGTPAQHQTVLDKYGLSRVGWIPGSNLHQLEYDTRERTLDQILKALKAEPAIGATAPNVMLRFNGIAPHVPKEVPAQTTEPYWHLVNTEAFEAFGLIQRGINRPTTQTVCVMDSGVWLSREGKEHVDLVGKLDLARSKAFGVPFGLYDGLQALADPDVEKPPHGNLIAGIIAAKWDGVAAVGIDPAARFVMVKQHPRNAMSAASNFAAGLQYLADQVLDGTATRVVVTSLSNTSYVDDTNAICAPAVASIINKHGLFIVAAGNRDASVATEGLVGIKPALAKIPAPPAQPFPVMVVTATEYDNVAFQLQRKGPERRWRVRPGEPTDASSNFAAAGDKGAVDIAAPGREVWGSDRDHSGHGRNGTSFAAPVVAGAASLVFSVLPPKTPAARVREILIKSGDPIHYTPATPPRRLESEAAKWIGETRVNIWQALLYALNQVSGTQVRYAGVRLSADRDDLQVSVVHKNGKPEKVPVPQGHVTTCVKHDPLRIDAMRMSFTGKGADFPERVRVEELQGNKWVSIFDQPLPITLKTIDALGFRPVFTRIAYTKGGLGLVTPKKADALPSNMASFEIENTGTAPTDADLLDPQGRHPHDLSLRPWMKLANGDAFALKVTLPPNAAALKVKFLDANRQPLPAAQVDDEQNPYVFVPFKPANNRIKLHVEGDFPPDPAVSEVKVEIDVFSLNNHLKAVKHSAVLRAPTETKPMLHRAPGWIFTSGDAYAPPSGAGPLIRRISIVPPHWTCRFTEGGRRGPKAPTPQPPVGGIITDEFGIRFVSPPTEPVGAVATVNVLITAKPPSTSYRGRFPGTLKLPDVEIVATGSPQSLSVTGTATATATFPIKIINRSRYAVWVKAIESLDSLLPAFTPPAGVPHALIRFEHPDPAWPPGEFELFDSATREAALTIAYHSRLFAQPPQPMATRRVKLVLVDPLAKTASPKYLSHEVIVQAVVRPPSPPGG